MATPSQLAATCFRLAVGEESVDAPPEDLQVAHDQRAAADIVHDGRLWLGSLLWLWAMVEGGHATRPQQAPTKALALST
jgi:hypothetical protein